MRNVGCSRRVDQDDTAHAPQCQEAYPYYVASTATDYCRVGAPKPASQAKPQTKKQKWEAGTRKALAGIKPYVDSKVAARGDKKLAFNLDIDDTSLATTYAPGKPVAATLSAVKYAKSKGVYIFFNTARLAENRAATLRQLHAAGYPVDDLCMAQSRGQVVESKQRCRQKFVDNGYVIIANIGNHDTDFVGGNYQKAYHLPDENGRLK